MSGASSSPLLMPWLPPGHTMVLEGRGEVFYRHHRHPDPAAPTVLLLHGWTASADLQFFTAYAAPIGSSWPMRPTMPRCWCRPSAWGR